jgi:AcrR family transcriptional regulator
VGRSLFPRGSLKPSTRDRIVAGAAEVFARQGVSGVVVADILTAADVARRTFYKHFRSTEDVLSAVYDELTHELMDAVLDTIRNEADPLKKVMGSVDAYLRHVVKHGQLIIALHAEAIRPGSALAPRREETYAAIVGGIDEAIFSLFQVHIDPLIFRALLLSVEGLVIHVSGEKPLTEADCQRVLAIASPLFLNVFAGYDRLPTASQDKPG